MSLIEMIFGKRQKTAAIARERLQIILAHERNGRSAPTICRRCSAN